jgi:hypothetical protein
MTFLAMFTVTVAYPALVAIIWTLGKLTVDGKIAWMAVLTVFPLVLVISLLMPIYRWFRREYPFVSSIFVVLNITTTFIRRGRSIMTDALKEMEREGYKSSRGKSD